MYIKQTTLHQKPLLTMRIDKVKMDYRSQITVAREN